MSTKIYLPHGTEVMMDLSHCDSQLLNSFERLDQIFTAAIESCGATILKKTWHQFEPQGLTVLYLLSESSFTFHSYPECGYCSLNVYTCGSCDPKKACDSIVAAFQLKEEDVCMSIIKRGNVNPITNTFVHTAQYCS